MDTLLCVLLAALLTVCASNVKGSDDTGCAGPNFLTNNARENGSLELQCNHSKNADITAIVWTEHGTNDAIAELHKKSMTIKRQDMKGRATISDPDGNLLLSRVRRSDAGCYQCLVIVGGIVYPQKWHNVNVIVPPEDLKIKCSGTVNNTPDEDCSIIRNDKIQSIQCEVSSYPKSNISWSSYPERCTSQRIFGGTDKTTDDGFTKQNTLGLTNVCEGRYCCQAQFNVGGVLNGSTVCIDIGEDQAAITISNQQDVKSDWMIIVAIIIAILFTGVIIIVCCICICIHYKRTRKQYPFGITYIPCIGKCEEKCVKKKPGLTVVVKDDIGIGESTALTPFLGPNHLASTNQHANVFNFIVNEAQDNNNVNRVKVTSTHDPEPSGEKSRTVEIYKKRESTGFLMPENKNVQPGLYRRALSNSDVSKIVYSEIVDENGKVKREIEIIKGFSQQDEPDGDDIERDYLSAATGVSLSPTTAFHSMQRQISNVPATASETDVRRAKLHRQATIESVRGSDDMWSHSYNSYRRPLKYQQSVSVDIDDVD